MGRHLPFSGLARNIQGDKYNLVCMSVYVYLSFLFCQSLSVYLEDFYCHWKCLWVSLVEFFSAVLTFCHLAA